MPASTYRRRRSPIRGRRGAFLGSVVPSKPDRARSGAASGLARLAAAAALTLTLLGCGALDSVDAGPPTLILVSIDAFRWDFLDRAPTPALDRLTREGVRAERLIPVFPSKTFPNHYSIVTGLYPERHGIVANTMYDPVFDAKFSLSNRAAVEDGRWWEGEPLWVTAERQGLPTATYFWPGSEAEIGGIRPSYWRRFDEKVPARERVDQALAWLDLPAETRPAFITLYFGEVDPAAHDHDPESAPEVAVAVASVDRSLGRLLDGLESRGLAGRVHLVVVSDHGMAATSRHRVIFLDDYLEPGQAEVVDWDPVASIRPREGEIEAVYAALRGAHPHLTVYRREEIPDRLHYRDHRRIAPIVAIADEGWSISSRDYYERDPGRFDGGNHGYDPALLSMGGLFIASGPALRQGAVVPPLEAIHLYSLMCNLLGIQPAPNDGDPEAIRHLLR